VPERTATVLEVLVAATRAIGELGRRFAMVGGLATSLRGEPRTTRDVDLAVAVDDDADAEALVRDLTARGYQIATILEQEATGRLATVRLVSAVDGITVVDLMFASCGIEPEVVAGATPIELAGTIIPVANRGHLVAMKLLARDDVTRPQDAADLVALRAKLESADIEVARAACRLIEARRANRGRDLERAFEAWLA
jgi:hypothetical protein